MAVQEIPFSGHLVGTGVQELRNLRLWQLGSAPGGATEGVFWYGSNTGDKRIWFEDDAGAVRVPRLDRNEGLTGQWIFAPATSQAPFALGTNAQGQLVTGLNADLLDGFNSNVNPTANTVAVRSSNGCLAVADPQGLTDAVNKQSLTATLGSATFAATQITSGILALNRGGAGSDLSTGTVGGVVWRDVSGLSVTNAPGGGVALPSVLISNGASGPLWVSPLPLSAGGTGGTSVNTARSSLGVLSALDTYGVVDGRMARRGLTCNGTSGYKITSATGQARGTGNWAVSVIATVDDVSTANNRTLFATHTSGNNRLALQVWNSTQVNLMVIDGSGTRTDYLFGIPAEAPLAAGTRYHFFLNVDRAGLATLYLNGQYTAAVDVTGAAAVNVGSGNASGWGAGYLFNGTIHALRTFNGALTLAEINRLSYLGTTQGITSAGVWLDLETETVNPAAYLTVRDRSGNAFDGTIDATVTSAEARLHTNTQTLLISSLSGNRVLYGGTGGMVSGVAANASGTAKFLTQASSNAPAWTDLFGGTNTWSGQQTFTGSVFINDPTAGGNPATRNYVDAAVAAVSTGLRPLQNAKAAATTNITLSGTQTVDGVALIAGDVCLVTGQTTASQNGLYTVAAGAWTRTTDADTAGEITKGAYVFVLSGGTNNGATSWYQTATVTTLGTDAVTFSKFFQQVAYAAGVGISLAGTTIAVNTAASIDWTGTHTFTNGSGVALKPYGTSAGNTTELRFMELAANGANYVGFKAADSLGANTVWTLPTADGAANQYLKTNGTGGLSFAQIASTEINNTNFLTGVNGTANRISVTGSLNATVDIAGTYAGQTSITTLGTISVGTWSATAIAANKGGTGQTSWNQGDILYAPTANNVGGLSISGSANRLLQSNGTTPGWSAFTFPASVAKNDLFYGSAANAVSALAAVASRVLVTDGSGNVGWGSALPGALTIGADTNNKLPMIRWFDVGDGSSTTITLTHNFGTKDLVVQTYDTATGKTVEVPTTRATINTVVLEFAAASAPGVNAYRTAILVKS